MRQTHYYLGVYQDGDDRICQVSDDVDGLSCEILATPGVLETLKPSVLAIRNFADTVADAFGCNFIELNCSKGRGSYHLIKC